MKTFEEAEKVGAFELARRWADRPARLRGETADRAREVDELATMAALREWLDRWLPLQMHCALLAGAQVAEVAAAAGMTSGEVVARWREWDSGQRALWLTCPDMDRTAEHDQVATAINEYQDRSGA